MAPRILGDLRGIYDDLLRRAGVSMSELVNVTFEDYCCRCSDRSRSFPATVSIAVDGGDFQAHQGAAGEGWCPCDTSEEEYTRLYSVVQELNFEAPLFADWQALVARVTAEANERSAEYWHQQWRAALDRQVGLAQAELEFALAQAECKRNALLLAECRAVAARVGAPDLAATAHRLLEENWVGTPAELLATAEAVLQR